MKNSQMERKTTNKLHISLCALVTLFNQTFLVIFLKVFQMIFFKHFQINIIKCMIIAMAICFNIANIAFVVIT